MANEGKAKYGCERHSKFRYGVNDRFWFFNVVTGIVWLYQKYSFFGQFFDTDSNYGISFTPAMISIIVSIFLDMNIPILKLLLLLRSDCYGVTHHFSNVLSLLWFCQITPINNLKALIIFPRYPLSFCAEFFIRFLINLKFWIFVTP